LNGVCSYSYRGDYREERCREEGLKESKEREAEMARGGRGVRRERQRRCRGLTWSMIESKIARGVEDSMQFT
jgi:uncharacterized protein (DUF58 family)